MPVTKKILLQHLPAYTPGNWRLVTAKQSVSDIISLIESKHAEFCSQYDAIGPYFIGDSIEETCDNLYFFCKDNLQYLEESEHFQTVGPPASILARGSEGVDCKSYALFIGGCLDAISRKTGKKINWFYRFASYDPLEEIPYHVFIAVNTAQGLLYVDPTPGSDSKEPFWIIDRPAESAAALAGFAIAGPVADPSWGTLMPPPAWYPAHLPLFYNNNDGFRLRPLGAVPGYSYNDVLDVLLYYQTLIGYNRTDYKNAKVAAWTNINQSKGSGRRYVEAALQANADGDSSGNFAFIPSDGYRVDGQLYTDMQNRYVQNEATARPWLSAMQATGNGIDLMTLPMGNDIEIPRPSWYKPHLPSLFYAAGNPGQYPAGHLDTKPKLIAGKMYISTKFDVPEYTVTPDDIANYMLYAQPAIYAGATPYPLNWFVNENVNGAMASYFKITLSFTEGHLNSQMQDWGATGNILVSPDLDANPYASGFTQTLQTIVSAAVNFFAGKIPGGTKAVQAAYLAGNITGGEFLTGGAMPPGQWSAAVFLAADKLNAKVKAAQTNKNILLVVLAAGGFLAWYYWDELKQ